MLISRRRKYQTQIGTIPSAELSYSLCAVKNAEMLSSVFSVAHTDISQAMGLSFVWPINVDAQQFKHFKKRKIVF